jgi:hypothetical protein
LYVPWVYTASSALIAAACFSAFALPACRPLMKSDLARVLVCYGLMHAPDWETKTFINVAYNTAIPFFFMVLLASGKEAMSVRRGVGLGLALGLCALSKPHFIAFAPGVAGLAMLTARRRQVGNTLMLALALGAISVQTTILLNHLPPMAQPSPPLAQLLMMVGRYQMLAVMALVGRHDHITLGWVHAAGFALVAVGLLRGGYRIYCRQTSDLILRVFAVGLSACIVGLGLAVKTNAYLLDDGSGVLNSPIMMTRHWYIPLVALFISVALGLQQSNNFFIKWPVFVMWLWAAWPFGISVEPMRFDWPLTGASAWQALVPYSPLGTNPLYAHRAYCIPVDPYPWHIGTACDPLVEQVSLAPLSTGTFTPVAGPFACPKEVTGQVTQIGFRLQGGDIGKRTLLALDADKKPLGVAKETPTFSNVLTYFVFDDPVPAPAHIVLVEGGDKVSSVVMGANNEAPQWLWLGVKGSTGAAL